VPMRFRAYLYSEKNCALAINLYSMLNENRALKCALKKFGIRNCFVGDESGCGESNQKYVFRRAETS